MLASCPVPSGRGGGEVCGLRMSVYFLLPSPPLLLHSAPSRDCPEQSATCRKAFFLVEA